MMVTLICLGIEKDEAVFQCVELSLNLRGAITLIPSEEEEDQHIIEIKLPQNLSHGEIDEDLVRNAYLSKLRELAEVRVILIQSELSKFEEERRTPSDAQKALETFQEKCRDC